MKKFLALLLAAVMAATVLVACGGDKTSSSAPQQQDESGAAQTGADPEPAPQQEGDPYEIVLMLVNYGMDIPDLGLIEEEVNKIIQPQINSTIKFLTVPISEQYMKLNLLTAGGEKVDLAMGGLTTNPTNLVGQGVLQPITGLVEGSEILYGLAEDLLDACTIDGEIYAYPGILYPAGGVMFTYNAELAREYGIEVPEQVASMDELEAVFQQVLDSDMEAYPIALGNGDCATPQNMGGGFDSLSDTSYHVVGAIMDGAPDTIANLYATDEYKEMALRMRSWNEKGYVEPTSYSNDYAPHDCLTAGISFGCFNAVGVGTSLSYWSSTTGVEVGGCWVSQEKQVTSGGTTSMSWVVPVTSEQPQKAVEFLELLFTDSELATLLNYGIEGKHYVRVEGTEGIISYPEGENGFTCGYGTFLNWYGDTATTYQMLPADDSFFEDLNSYSVAGGAKLAPSFGYTFDSTSVATEISAVTTVVTEYRPGLECGLIADVEGYYNEFLQALDNAGINKIIEENQAQYDAWRAANS